MTRTAIELAAAATRLGSPEEGLRAIAALRRRLDDLEAWHVEAAVRAGRSWTQIADCLGVSKQAAHKKHAARIAENDRPSIAAAAREHGVVVTAEARRIAHHAAREARRLGHPRLGTGHLLLGLLHEAHAAAAALGRLGVSLDALQAVIARPKTREEVPPEGAIPISPQGRAALEQSLREAVARGESELRPEHLLLALLRDERSDAVRTLTRLGVAPRDLERALAASPGTGRNVRLRA